MDRRDSLMLERVMKPMVAVTNEATGAEVQYQMALGEERVG